LVETRLVKLSAEKVHNTILNYFAEDPAFEVKKSLKSSYIEVRVAGTWTKAPHGGPCTLRINVLPKNGESQIEFNFNYRTLFMKSLLVLAFFIILDFLMNLLLKIGRLGELSVFVFVLFCILVIWGSRTERTTTINEIMALLKGAEVSEL
jgi:hypothetical protein